MKKYALILLVIFSSCGGIDCKRLSEIYRNYECLLIIKKIDDINSVSNFDVSGISLKTNRDTIYEEQNRWYCTYYKDMSVGDTIIKRKGELTFNIHKKDTILSFNWECEGKVYK